MMLLRTAFLVVVAACLSGCSGAGDGGNWIRSIALASDNFSVPANAKCTTVYTLIPQGERDVHAVGVSYPFRTPPQRHSISTGTASQLTEVAWLVPDGVYDHVALTKAARWIDPSSGDAESVTDDDGDSVTLAWVAHASSIAEAEEPAPTGYKWIAYQTNYFVGPLTYTSSLISVEVHLGIVDPTPPNIPTTYAFRAFKRESDGAILESQKSVLVTVNHDDVSVTSISPTTGSGSGGTTRACNICSVISLSRP